MKCSWCGKKIRRLSALLGNSHCSEEHRRLEAELSETDAAKLTIERLLLSVVRDEIALNPQKRAVQYQEDSSLAPP